VSTKTRSPLPIPSDANTDANLLLRSANSL
jgi:hypothetical protein